MNFSGFFFVDSQCSVEAAFKASVVSVGVAFAMAFALEEMTACKDGAHQANSANPVLEVKPCTSTCHCNRKQYQRVCLHVLNPFIIIPSDLCPLSRIYLLKLCHLSRIQIAASVGNGLIQF